MRWRLTGVSRMPEHALKYNGYFTRPDFWALDQACKPIREAFPDFGTYLVGSVMERPDLLPAPTVQTAAA